MKLHLFAEWIGYTLGLLAVIAFALAIVAAASGFAGWAVVAAVTFMIAVTLALALVGGTVRHDHRQRRHTPRFPLPGGTAWPVKP
ncbi:hypothetical protein [Rhodococcus sp. Q]|uniref:hypothetical protein n=1 Tax=Rhodococcus sp. Q TaxID=2502252 RepID=UPI0010F4D8A5|nr:hypothetical protein [Rhodococcus sp. Q]